MIKNLLISAIFAISIILAIAFIYSKCMQIQALEQRVSLLEERQQRKEIPLIKVRKATIYNGSGEVYIIDERERIEKLRDGK